MTASALGNLLILVATVGWGLGWLPQIIKSYIRKTTNDLSFLSYFLSFVACAGYLAGMWLKAEYFVVVCELIPLSLNFVVLYQILYYRKRG